MFRKIVNRGLVVAGAVGSSVLALGLTAAHAAPLDATDVGNMFTNTGTTGMLDVIKADLSTNLPLVIGTVVAVFVIFLLIRVGFALTRRAAK